MNNEKVFFTTQSNIRFLLTTANTGTVFEKPELLTAWVNEFANLIRRHPADFIALHCQEVGGKDYERFMHILDPFIKDILEIPEIAKDFTRYRFYFDSDYTSQDTFTALGSAYFIRQNIPIKQWNFITSSFHDVVNRQIFTGSLVNVQTLRKEKFPREFFSEAKWSRKGFTQTRWSIDNFVFDMVNIHLFHDASNLLAIERSPSVYSNFRKNALEYTLRSLPLNTSDAPVPFAIFGDFNFRLDTHRLIQYIAEYRNGSIDKINHANSDEISKVIIKNAQDKTNLTIKKKEFNLYDDHDSFFHTDSYRFHPYDFEFESFSEQLFEYDKIFPPSYPFSEEHDEARSYLRVRCPAWCDRVLLSHTFKNAVQTEMNPPIYNLIGEDVCMGDHKPVYLSFTTHLTQDGVADANTHPCETVITTSNINHINQLESPVTVRRKKGSDLILNETQLSSDDIHHFNVHDYALFGQPTILPPWWENKLRERVNKTLNTTNILWAKVRAVTYMTTLGHRTGSWYSDDLTEKTTLDDTSSLSDNENEPTNNLTNTQFNDVEDYRAPHLHMPIRRSFSSIERVKHDEVHSSALSRSRSTTLINSSDHLTSPLPVELPSPPTPPPPPPPSTSRIHENIQESRNLTFAATEFDALKLMNNKIIRKDSSSTTVEHSKTQPEDTTQKRVTFDPATATDNNDNDDDVHRTVFARHLFHANVKQTLTRWIRETPV